MSPLSPKGHRSSVPAGTSWMRDLEQVTEPLHLHAYTPAPRGAGGAAFSGRALHGSRHLWGTCCVLAAHQALLLALVITPS